MNHKFTAIVLAGGVAACEGRFAMDFQGTAGKEVAALQSRQQYLATLAEQKRCGASMASIPQTGESPR